MITIYQWLTKFQELERQIDYLEYEIDDCESELRRWVSGDLSGVRLEKKSRSANLEPIIEEKKHDLSVLNERKLKLLNFVYKFDDLDSRILIKKYVENKKLEDVAEELGYSYSHVQRLHAALVKTLRYVDKIHH